MRHGRFIRSLHEDVLIRRPDPGVPFGFELLSKFSCVVEQYRFYVNTDLTLNVQEKVFQVSVSPPNDTVQLDDHLIRLKFLSDITETEDVSPVLIGNWILEPVHSRSDDVSPFYYFSYIDSEGNDTRTELNRVVKGDYLVFRNALGVEERLEVLSFASGTEGLYIRFVDDARVSFELSSALRVTRSHRTQTEDYYNQKENVLRVRNIESHPKAQLLEAVELGVLN